MSRLSKVVDARWAGVLGCFFSSSPCGLSGCRSGCYDVRLLVSRTTAGWSGLTARRAAPAPSFSCRRNQEGAPPSWELLHSASRTGSTTCLSPTHRTRRAGTESTRYVVQSGRQTDQRPQTPFGGIRTKPRCSQLPTIFLICEWGPSTMNRPVKTDGRVVGLVHP